MNIAYITSVNLDKKQAQANQIKSMLRTFGEKKGINFYAIISDCDYNSTSVKMIKRDAKFFGKLKKAIFPLIVLPEVYKNKIRFVYCREIAIALIYSILNKSVIYELHEINNNNIQLLIIKFLSFFKKFSVVTVSNKGKHDIHSMIKRLKVVSLPNGAFWSDYTDLILSREKLYKTIFNTTKDNINIVYTGSLYKGNDADIIFDFAKLRDDIVLHCIGGSKEEFNIIAQKNGNPRNVIHTAFVETKIVREYQVSADILLYPLSETNAIKNHTSPLKVFEYMSSRRPILASNIGAVAELLNNENCYIYENNIKSMTQVLNSAIRDIYISNTTKADKAFSEVSTKYSWSNRVSSIIEIYKNQI